MGAVWALKKEYMTILLPHFDYQEIKGAINPRQISLKLDSDQGEMKERIEEMRTKLSKELSCLQLLLRDGRGIGIGLLRMCWRWMIGFRRFEI